MSTLNTTNIKNPSSATNNIVLDASGNVTISGTLNPGSALVVPSGTATAPALSFTSDPNTGIYSPGADQLAISTNGTGRLFVDASGNVGVNTSSPSSMMEINGGFLTSIRYGTSGAGIWRRANGTASSPTTVLNGETTSLLVLQGYGTSIYKTGATISTVARQNYADAAVGTDLIFSVTNINVAGPEERLRLTAEGRLGLGTSSPTDLLTVNGNVNVDSGTFFVDATNNRVGINNTSPQTALGFSDGNNISWGTSNFPYITGNSSSNHLAFGTQATERARIDSSGRLLVGTSTARDAGGNFGASTGKHIHIETTDIAVFTGIANKTSGATAVLTLGAAVGSAVNSNGLVINAQVLGKLQFVGGDGSDVDSVAAQITAEVDGTPGANDMPGRLVFYTTSDNSASPSERLRVDSNGFASHTGAIGRGAPVTKTGAFTVGVAENWLICNGTASITVTLPAASAWTGREIMIKTIAAFTVISASSNVVPLAGGAAGTAILAATAGKFATLVSDGTSWIIMQAN